MITPVTEQWKQWMNRTAAAMKLQNEKVLDTDNRKA